MGPLNMSTETWTHAFALHYLLVEACPVVEAFLPLVDWIDRNRAEWVWIVAEQDTTKRFAYDVSWIVLAYLNACILALTAAAKREPGARTLVSFQYLIDELNHGWYRGRTLPRSLQDLLTFRACRRAALALAAAQPPPATQIIDVGSRSGGRGRLIVPRRRCWNHHNGEVTPNLFPIQHLHIISGDNTWGM